MKNYLILLDASLEKNIVYLIKHLSMKIPKTPKGEEVWQKIKAGELNGFSVSGYFEEVAKFTKEEMFLFKLEEILKQTGNN